MHSGIDLTTFDRSVRPQDDLFRFVNGTWLATTDIPPDRARFGTFDMLREEASARVRDLIEEAAAATSTELDAAQKVGDLYRSFMDVETVAARGLTPIADDLAAIEAVTDLPGLARLVGRFARQDVPGFVAVIIDVDEKDPQSYVAYLEQAGLGLPDEAYYREEKFAAIRTAYSSHIDKLLTLAGVGSEGAGQRLLALETRIASAHWDNVSTRDADRTYNPMTRAELEAHASGIPWAEFIDGIGAPATVFDKVIVREPSFVTGLAAALHEESLADWKIWARYHLVRAMAPFLTEELVAEDFDFTGRVISGMPQIKDRWKRGVMLVEGYLGEAAGQLYVAKWFPPEAKERMVTLVAHLVEAFRRSFAALEWMSPETRAAAEAKLATFRPKIGYPDTWRDYTAYDVVADDLVGNVRRGAAFELERAFAKLGRPVDRDEWFMPPQTVNAYYNPTMNEIVFPAGILQPPFFDPEADDAVNYGGIGAVIGHEIGHGFDDQGSKYDGSGALNNWWTTADRTAFEDRAAALIDQFDGFVPTGLDDTHRVNGALTVGENIGDLGGLQIGYAAYRIANSDDEERMPVIDGFTGPQRFFVGWAQVWRGKAREAEAIRLLAIDPHSPAEFRANAVRNVDAFHEAFGLGPGDALWVAPEDRVTVF